MAATDTSYRVPHVSRIASAQVIIEVRILRDAKLPVLQVDFCQKRRPRLYRICARFVNSEICNEVF